MNFLHQNRQKLKQELPAIVVLSILQIIISYTFAPYQHLAPLYGNTVALLVSIFSIIVLVRAFSTAQDYAYYINFDSYEDLPDAQHREFFKKLTQYTIVIIFCTVMYVYWRIDFLNMPTSYYLLLYTQFFLALVLFYRAANRSPE